MTKFDEDLGQALKECRKSKGLTQKQVADYFGITKMAVSYWESGINAMTAEQLSGNGSTPVVFHYPLLIAVICLLFHVKIG